MRICEHITNFEHFNAINRIGYIIANDRQREFGMQGHSFGSDYLAGDRRYIFFSTGNAYRSITEEPSYGFVFDAHFLVSEHGALVGTDLMTEYDQLYHEIAREVAEQLGSKPMITDTELNDFAERHGITDRYVLDAIREDSMSAYQDVLIGMWNIDKTVEGAEAGIRLFQERVGDVQAKHRRAGNDAHKRLNAEESDPCLLISLELLVPRPLPIEYAYYTGSLEKIQRGVHR